MREPKEGAKLSHAFQGPFHGVGGYVYIYIYISICIIYIYIYYIYIYIVSNDPVKELEL